MPWGREEISIVQCDDDTVYQNLPRIRMWGTQGWLKEEFKNQKFSAQSCFQGSLE